MAGLAVLQPISPRAFDEARARHLLRRAGFGGGPQAVRELAAMGLDAAVDHMVDYRKLGAADIADAGVDPDVVRPPTADERQRARRAFIANDQAELERIREERQRRQRDELEQAQRAAFWWLRLMLETPRPLEEKLVLLWHSHFASSYRDVRDAWLMLQQQALFREHANGSFADLARGVVRDPAMIRFLNNDQNRKQQPNENLARELMELFTLGEGHYTEADIKQGARALTGYTYDDNDFVFRRNVHDDGTKTILGETGRFDGDGFVELLLKQRACADFVAYKLYRHFVADVDDRMTRADQRAIAALAELLREHDFELRPVLTILFKSRHFHSDLVVGHKIKSPAQLVVGAARELATPQRDPAVVYQSMRLMGQALFAPPTVAGWDGGRSWINTSTLFMRQNLTTYLIAGRGRRGGVDGVAYDPEPLIGDLPRRTPEAVVDRLIETLIAPPLARERRDELLTFAGSGGSNVAPRIVIGLLLLITAMPEYQLC